MKHSDTFLLPGESLDWEVWAINGARKGKMRNRVAEPDEVKKMDGMVIGLPATRCRTFGLQLPATDRSVLGDMVYAQLEKRGLGTPERSDCIFQVHVVDEQPDRSVVSVDVLPADFPDDLCFPSAGGYTSASRLLPLPKGKLTLWVERGRLILAANRSGRLVFSQAIGAEAEITPAAASTIALTALSLEAEGLVTDVDGLIVWGDFPKEQIELLQKKIPLKVTLVERPQPVSTAGTSPVVGDLIPIQVQSARAASSRRRKAILITLAAIALYAVIALFIFLKLKTLGDQADEHRREIAKNSPIAQMVKDTQQRWEEFQPAVNIDRFIMVQLNEITKMFPPGGLVLRKYEAKPDRIEIDGSARDPQVAFQFLEDIKKNPIFAGYSWNMGQPKVNSDKSATFEIVGTYGSGN